MSTVKVLYEYNNFCDRTPTGPERSLVADCSAIIVSHVRVFLLIILL